MEIFLEEIPEDGLHCQGELAVGIFELPPHDPIRPVTPVQFDAMLYRVDGGVVLTGRLRGNFQLQCGTCLDYFEYEADFPDWSSDIELGEKQSSFNLAEVIREDLLLDLPSSPRCEDFSKDRVCPHASLLATFDSTEAEDDPARPADPDVWKALDEW